MRPFALGADPLEGESLPGFIMRAAGRLRLPKADPFAARFGFRQPGSAFGDHSLEAMAWRIGARPAVLEGIAYRPADRPKHHRFLGGLLHREFIDVSRRRFCPRCLEDAPYHRARWDLSLATACPEHGCRLATGCPECRRKPDWSLLPIASCRCGVRLSGSPATVAGPSETGANRMLLGLAAAVPPRWLPETLRHLPGQDLLWLSMCLGMFFTGWRGQRRIEALVAAGPDAVAAVTVAGTAALAGWPTPLQDYLRAQMDGAAARRGRFGARKALGGFYGWLTGMPDGELKDVLASAARGLADGDAVLARRSHRSRLLADGNRARDLVGLAEAGEALGMSGERVKHLIAAGRMPRSESEGRGVPMLIDRAAVEDLASGLRDSMHLAAAARFLGISEARTRKLAQSGVLTASKPGSSATAAAWSFQGEQLRGLLDRLATVTAEPGGRTVGFGTAVGSLGRRGLDLTEAIRLIESGGLPVAALDPAGQGLKRLRFHAADLRWACMQLPAAASLTVQECAGRIGLKWEVVANLVRRGLLEARDGLVSEADLGAFVDKHVTGSALAKLRGTSPRALARRLAAEGVLPVAGPEVDGSRQNIYRRDSCLQADPARP